MGVSVKLTDLKIRQSAAAEKDYKLPDGQGLYLVVTKSGSKLWRQKYRFGGKEKLLSHGPYPEVSLLAARKLREQARQILRDGDDPAVVKRRTSLSKKIAATNTLEVVAREWFEQQKPRWAEVHSADVIRSLERDIFPAIGRLPIADINAPLILDTLRAVERRGSIETAKRLRQRLSAIFVYAISEGRAKEDPAAIVTKALKPLIKKGRQPALLSIDELRELIIRTEATRARLETKFASRLLALTAVRPSVIRGAEWEEFSGIDWTDEQSSSKNAMWRVPAARMKLPQDKKQDKNHEHVVPLSWQAVELLRDIRPLTGHARLVFPSERHIHRPLSENAIGYYYNRAGYHGRHVPHGWRAAFSTIMNERHPADRAIIDMMLAHVPKDKVEAAYNRAQHVQRRRELAQEWADILMEGLPPVSVYLKQMWKPD